jgi:hypothetical protein
VGRMSDRVRFTGRLVGSALARDLEARGTRRLDASLPVPAGGARVAFAADPRFGTRRLPAVASENVSPQEYVRALHGRVVDLLGAHGFGYVQWSRDLDHRPQLGIRDAQWSGALRVLGDSIPGALLAVSADGGEPQSARYASTLDSLDPDQVRDADTAHLLVPALVRREGEVVRRLGFETALRIDKWVAGEDRAIARASAWNPRTSLVEASLFDRRTGRDHDAPGSLDVLSAPHLMQVTFPIDAVFTWVDGTDPQWLARKRQALESAAGERMPEAAADDLRFVGHDELRYSLRSLEQYAPWIRHVYIVTDRQRPAWLREDCDWISIVDHREIAPGGTVLPTFNSQAIEANLHLIEGLSEHFLYFNDDMFLSSPVAPDLFFHANGLASVHLSRAHVAPGPPVEGEPAPDAAGKNARALVEEVCGRRLGRKLFHAPYALQRSVSAEIEERWPEVIRRTRDSQFRRLDDVTLAGGLHLNYAYAVGRAVTREIRYRYVGIGELTAASELERLMKDRDSLQTFCLNDAVQEIPPEISDRQVRDFLARRFPDVGSFERLDG